MSVRSSDLRRCRTEFESFPWQWKHMMMLRVENIRRRNWKSCVWQPRSKQIWTTIFMRYIRDRLSRTDYFRSSRATNTGYHVQILNVVPWRFVSRFLFRMVILVGHLTVLNPSLNATELLCSSISAMKHGPRHALIACSDALVFSACDWVKLLIHSFWRYIM